jgi:hypothetical protein
MHICTLCYNPSPFLTLRVPVTLSAYLHHRGVNFWLGNTDSLQLSNNKQKTKTIGKSKTLKGAIVFLHSNQIAAVTFLTPRTITLTVQSTHSSDGMKHGFRVHRMFTTGQKTKLLQNLDLHRLVSCKADIHVTAPGLILVLAELHSLYKQTPSNLSVSEFKHQSCRSTGA